jgi:hypothetical protein
MQRTQKWAFRLALTLGIVVLAVLVLKGSRATSVARPQAQQGFLNAIKRGLGEGCPFGGNSSPTTVVNNLANFLNSRSGIVLSQSVKDRLIEMETQTMYGGRPRKTISEISNTLYDTWLERVGQLTNSEIAQIGECTRTAVDVPFNNSQGVMGRASGRLIINSMSKWLSDATAYRDASTSEAVAARTAAPSAIYDEVDRRLQLYEQALPDQWNRGTGYTPVQAFLLSYSAVADDLLHQSPAELTQAMQALEASIHQNFPSCQTSCVNRKPYGYMGYLYSTHIPYLFNETVQKRLMDRL